MKQPAYLILRLDDWLAIYVKGESVFQDHNIEPVELLRLAEKYEFLSSELVERYADEEDEEEANESGGLPQSVFDLKTEYFIEDQPFVENEYYKKN